MVILLRVPELGDLYLGVCLVAVMAVTELARDVLWYVEGKFSRVWSRYPYPVIDLMPDQE